MSELSYLRSNFNQIYSASRSPNKGELVANYGGTKVYDASKGLGRVWIWIYSFLEFFTNEDLKDSKLEKAIKKIHYVYEKLRINIEADIKKYRKYLLNQPPDESSVHPLRRRITNWNRATKFFFKHLVQTEIFQKHFSSPDQQELEVLSKMQKVITLEGYLQQPLPLNLISKVGSNEELNSDEEVELKRWIKKLKKLPIRDVHRFHTALAKIWEDTYPNFKVEVLERALQENGFSEIAKPDPKHMSLKNTLKKGVTITCNGKEYLLGEQIGKKTESPDRMSYFSLPDHPDKLLACAYNEAHFFLRQSVGEKEQWILKSAQVYEIDPSGRYAIVERFNELIENHTWSSTEKKLTQEDINFADPIAKLVKFMIKKEMTPGNLDPHFIMYDQGGTLRSVKDCTWQLFSFDKLEHFFFACANGNLRVFKYLMKKSKLRKHPNSDFYHAVMESAYTGQYLNIKDAADVYLVERPHGLERAKFLTNTFCQYAKQRAFDEDIDEKTAKELIYQQYLDSGAAGIFPITVP